MLHVKYYDIALEKKQGEVGFVIILEGQSSYKKLPRDQNHDHGTLHEGKSYYHKGHERERLIENN